MSDWKEYIFSDFVEINPSVFLPANGDVSFVEMKDLNESQKYCYPSSERDTRSGSKFKNNDTLFARITPCLENGKICQVKGLINNVGLGSTEFFVFRGKEGISDTDFVFYLSRWDDVRSHAEINLDGTSGRQRVPKACFDDLIIKMPPTVDEQKSIASILSSLDDKIDLLLRQNNTLEKMAETLFRQWFLEETKEEWKEISLYDAIELVGGGTPKTSVNEYWDGNIKWLSGGDIAANHKNFVVSSEKSITELGLKNSSAKLLPKFSTVISARGTVGKYCILSEPMAYSQSNYGVLSKYKDCFFFTYLLVAHSVDELQSAAYGSVFDTITTNTFKGITISLPEEENIIQFNESVTPYFFKILTNQTQIHTLTALRDTLLPKLMSGEVRVRQ
jgi:type I restriction enzyme S subunit